MTRQSRLAACALVTGGDACMVPTTPSSTVFVTCDARRPHLPAPRRVAPRPAPPRPAPCSWPECQGRGGPGRAARGGVKVTQSSQSCCGSRGCVLHSPLASPPCPPACLPLPLPLPLPSSSPLPSSPSPLFTLPNTFTLLSSPLSPLIPPSPPSEHPITLPVAYSLSSPPLLPSPSPLLHSP